MRPCFEREVESRKALYWEHEGNAAVRRRPWKPVCKHPGAWELYDMDVDRSEIHDLAARHPESVRELEALNELWAKRCNVLPWEEIQRRRVARK